jgi:hypothetical protein
MESWPRVSTILKILDDSYGSVPAEVLAVAAERGERLHRLCLTYLAACGGLCEFDESTVQGEDRLAFITFVDWVVAHKVVPLAIEQEDVCTEHQYRGTPDGMVLYGPKQIPTLIDLKFTATIIRINRVQIQVYGKLDLFKGCKQKMLVHITPKDGCLKQETVKPNPRDVAAFLNALSLYRWRQV